MNKRVLIADDDQDTANTLAMLLEQHGCEVRVAYNGQHAVEVAQAFEPDVFILDLTMPALDGFETATRLREFPKFKGKHFIACTGHEDQGHLDRASRVKFDDYLIKPCKLDVIMEILNEVGLK